MATLNFENDINGTEEKTYIISPQTSRTQMAKIMNRAFNGTKWYTRENANDDWAYFSKQSDLDVINTVCEKYEWVISKSPKIEKNSQTATDWRNQDPTQKQIGYLISLRVDIRRVENLTRGKASDLIEAAKNDQLGNVMGGFYMDGSN